MVIDSRGRLKFSLPLLLILILKFELCCQTDSESLAIRMCERIMG